MSESLNNNPHLFIAGLPAGEAVDHVLTTWDGAWSVDATHEGSERAFDRISTVHRDYFITMCRNPTTLARLATSVKDSAHLLTHIVTHPLTPRTPEVQQATQSLGMWNLQHAFAGYLVHSLAHHYDADTHADLLARLTEDEDALAGALAYQDAPAELELPNLDQLFVRHPETATKLNEAYRDARAPILELLGPDLGQYHGLDPRNLSEVELADLQRALTAHLISGYQGRSVRSIAVSFNHVLSLEDLQNFQFVTPNHWIKDAGMADHVPVWAKECIEADLDARYTKYVPAVDLLAPVGKHLWDELDGTNPAFNLAAELIDSGWEGSLTELVETVKATTK